MTSGGNRFYDANGDCGEHTGEKQIGREEKDAAGFAHATEVNDGNEQEREQAKGKCFRMKRRNGGSESADAG